VASWKKIISEDSSGVASISTKLGVGTSSPSQIFHVRDDANSMDMFSVRSTGSETRIGIGKNSADCAIDFSTSLPNGGGTIQNAFRMNYIDNVRTGSHNGRLVLQSNNGIRIAGYNDNPSGNAYGLEVKNTRDGASDKVLNIMKYDSTSLMTVKSNGAIGLGTDSPAHELDIQGSNSGGTFIQIRDTGDDYPVGIAFNHGVGGHQYGWYAGTMDGTSGERKFTIGTKVVDGFHNDLTTSSYSLLELNQSDSSTQFRGGKVWIGNTHNNGQTWASMSSKGNELILDGGANSGLTIVTDNNEAGYITHNNYNNGDYQHINFDSANAGMFFKAGGTDNVLALKSAGVGIGVASPAYKLDVSTGMRINRSGNDPYILLHRDGSGVGQIRGVSGGGINLTAASSSTSRLYINSSGDIGINHTSPSAMLDVAGSLKIQGNATFDQQVTHEDMVTFNSDVSFTNASIEGLSVSTSKILVLQSSAASSGQDINDSTRDIYWASMSTENNTYVSWAAGSGGYYISFAQAGEYMVYVDLIVTDATANDRMNFFGWISHMNSSNSVYYKYPLGGTYIRDDNSLYDSGGIGGSARLIVSANDRVKVNTQRFDSQDELDDNPLSTSLSRIRIEKINYNLSTG